MKVDERKRKGPVPDERRDELPRVELRPADTRLDRLAGNVLHERRCEAVVELEVGLVVEEVEGLEVLPRLNVVRDDTLKIFNQRREEREVLDVAV